MTSSEVEMEGRNKKRKKQDPKITGGGEVVLALQDLVKREVWLSLGDGEDMATVFPVPAELRDQKPEAYKPVMVSLGPYHDYNIGLEYKKFYLIQFLNKCGISAEEYVKRIRVWKEETSPFYSSMKFHYRFDNKGAFTLLLVYNCCFVAAVIRKYEKKDDDDDKNHHLRKRIYDPIFSVPHRLPGVLHDMLLVENQLPFYVLKKVFQMMIPADDRDYSKSFDSMVAKIINDNFGDFGFIDPPRHRLYPHLLDFVHVNWCPNYENYDFAEKILSASELRENAAVNFNKADNQKFFYVSFEKGTFNIPTISIDKKTEDLLRNMIAYEQTVLRCPDADYGGRKSYVTDYMILMSWLINTTDDVKLLCDSGGIINGMGMDHNSILRFFVAFGVHGCHNCPSFYYFDVADKVNRHCDKKRNKFMGNLRKWMAALQREIFPSPWAYISFFAALMLLVLTLLQTINSF